MTILFLLIGVAALAGIAFAVLRKKPEALAPGEAAKETLAAPKALAKLEAKAEKSERAASVKPPAKGERPEPQPKARNEAPAAAAAEQAPAATKAPNKKDVEALRKGLAATRGGFMARLKALFTGKKEIDAGILEQLEEVMISSDVGVKTTQAILGRLRER